jgi:acyl-CoA hydrolase
MAKAPKRVPNRNNSSAVSATAKPVSASRSEVIEAVLPNDANVLGTMLGGRVMHLIDIAGALAATRHSNSYVVTASVDYLDFRFPIQVGEFIVLRASVNRVFHSSMEVGVKVFAENPLTGQQRHTSTAYLTFVALDANRLPHPAPAVIPETEEEKRRYRNAGERRDYRLTMRHKREAEED